MLCLVLQNGQRMVLPARPKPSSHGCCCCKDKDKWQMLHPSPAAGVFSFQFCRSAAFLSPFPPCSATQENKKAPLTSALLSSYARALSELPIKPLPTRRRGLAPARVPREQRLPRWLVRVYFPCSLRLWRTGVSASIRPDSRGDRRVSRQGCRGGSWRRREWGGKDAATYVEISHC